MVFTGKESLQKEEKKIAQIKTQKYLSSLKKELSEKVTKGEVRIQTLQMVSCSIFCTLFFIGFGNLNRL